MNNERIEYLESRLGKTQAERNKLEKKYQSNFEKYASYMGNGVYAWQDIYANDTRKLFLMGVLRQEGITFKEE